MSEREKPNYRKQSSSTPAPESALTVVDYQGKNEDGRYIVGTVKNNTNNQYRYVQVEFNLYNKGGDQIGSTIANVNNLEPYGTWKFKQS